MSPNPRTANPFLVLSASLILQLPAGILYWWPALTPGLQYHLHLTESQSVALVATANSGSLLGIFGGLFHDKYGSRLTATIGALGSTLCFLSLFILVSFVPPATSNPFVFWIALALTLSVVTFSYMIYSSCITAAAAMFAAKYRGRVVGLCASFYGAAAAVFAAFQAALFPSLEYTPALLLFVVVFCAACAILAAVAFPGKESYEVEETSVENGDTTYGTVSVQHVHSSVQPCLRLAYAIAWLVVVALLSAAVVEALGLSPLLQKLCAGGVAVALASFASLPILSRRVVRERSDMGEGMIEPLPPFLEVAKDWRYLYLCLGFLVLVGGGGVALLVQAPSIVANRLYFRADPTFTVYDPEAVGVMVRTFVTIFSACNLLARLSVGAIMDRGESAIERMMWKYDIMVTNSLVMGIALFAIAFARSWVIYLVVGLIGLCYGTWFSTSPALTTLFFGVQSFPRNFALLGPLVTLGSATLASTVPGLLRSVFGSWTDFPVLDSKGERVQHVCNDISCSVPVFCCLAVLQVVMYGLGRQLRRFVLEQGTKYR